MTKKKNAPVLRGVDPEPNTLTKSYTVRDDWKDKSIVNYVAFKSVDGDVQDLTVNGEPAGGGGSVKYSSVNCTNPGATGFSIYLPNVDFEGADSIFTEITMEPNANFDVIVLTGSLATQGTVDLTGVSGTLTVTGDVTILGHTGSKYFIEVTGDGTITIS